MDSPPVQVTLEPQRAPKRPLVITPFAQESMPAPKRARLNFVGDARILRRLNVDRTIKSSIISYSPTSNSSHSYPNMPTSFSSTSSNSSSNTSSQQNQLGSNQGQSTTRQRAAASQAGSSGSNSSSSNTTVPSSGTSRQDQLKNGLKPSSTSPKSVNPTKLISALIRLAIRCGLTTTPLNDHVRLRNLFQLTL